MKQVLQSTFQHFKYQPFSHLPLVKPPLGFFFVSIISEIAWNLGYSSIQHFSAQFKKTTDITPSQYRKLNEKPRKSLDKVMG
ncbi:MAG: helix-turn-helix domain-containing protein [Cyclobacteriaceae bacterium]